MDNTAKGFTQKIISELEGIKRLIHDALMLPQHKPDQSNGKQGEANHSNANPKVRADHASAKSVPAPSADNHPDDKKRYTYSWILRNKPVWEFVGLLILIAYTIFAGFQWRAMLESNRLSRAALQISQRAYLHGKKITSVEDDKALTITLEIENSGHLPSKGTVVNVQCIRPGVSDIPACTSGPIGGEFTNIYPGTPYSIVMPTARLFDYERRDLRGGKHPVIAVHGEVYYGTGFEKQINLSIFCYNYWSEG